MGDAVNAGLAGVERDVRPRAAGGPGRPGLVEGALRYPGRPERPGLVALVGAGPGRADLITVRGRELLEHADVVVHDRLDTEELLAWAGAATPTGHARLIDVGKRAGNHPVPQTEICELLVREARHARLVVRLKGGDPYVFGRGGEEASALAEAGVPFEVVPGVTSALAAASYAGVPVTDRRHSASFHVLTGHRRADGELGIDYGALVRAGGTDVFLMAVRTLGEVTSGLLGAGASPDTPACVVERGTLPDQRRIDATLATVAQAAHEAGVESPAVLVVGAVCALAGELDWFDALPLRGSTVAVTRPQGRARGLASELRALGARVVETPLIETRPRPSFELAAAVRGLSAYAWLVLTSAEGARCLRAALEAAALDARALAPVRVAAVGPATAAALSALGIVADLVPEVFDTEHLAEALVERVRSGERVLLFRSADGSPALPRILGEAGVAFDDVAAYDTLELEDEATARLAASVLSGEVHAVTLTSASCARALGQALARAARGAGTPNPKPNPGFELLRSGAPAVEWPDSCVAVCLGPSTYAAACALGMRCVCAREATASALVAATCATLARS